MEHGESRSGNEGGRRTRRAAGLVVSMLVIVTLAMTGCASTGPGNADGETLRVGVLPDRTPETLRERYSPLVEHLSAYTDREVELAIPESYEELLEWFHEGRVKLAWFGGLTFLQAERRSGARALVMRDVDLRFTSDFLVARSRPERSLEEYTGATLAFGPFLSTSGHLMPRDHLQRTGIDPETFFTDVRHSTGHDQTALWVQEGQVDIGVVNSIVVESMFRDGSLSAGLVQVLQATPPYRNYVWAVAPDLPASIRTDLQDGFLALQMSIPEQAKILEAQGAEGYVPANRSDYDDLRRAAAALGLLDGKDS